MRFLVTLLSAARCGPVGRLFTKTNGRPPLPLVVASVIGGCQDRMPAIPTDPSSLPSHVALEVATSQDGMVAVSATGPFGLRASEEEAVAAPLVGLVHGPLSVQVVPLPGSSAACASGLALACALEALTMEEAGHGLERGRWDGYRFAASALARQCAPHKSWYTTLYGELGLPPDHKGGLGLGYDGHCLINAKGTIVPTNEVVAAEKAATRAYVAHYEAAIGSCEVSTSKVRLRELSAGLDYRERVMEPRWDATLDGIVVSAVVDTGRETLHGGALWRGEAFDAQYWDLGLASATACTWIGAPEEVVAGLEGDGEAHFARAARMLAAALESVGVQEARLDAPPPGWRGTREEVALWMQQSELHGWWRCLGDG